VPDAEATGDGPVLAETLANLARAYMRTARAEAAVQVADRALAIAERLNLEAIVAEALVNKGSALMMLGRRRESIALQEAALELAKGQDEVGLQMRIRNNLASSTTEDQPLRGLQMTLESVEIARQLGDRGMFNWVVGFAAVLVAYAGRDWDAQLELLREALDGATLRADRSRLTALKAIIEIARGERLDEIPAELRELVGASTDPDDMFGLMITTADAAHASGDYATAYRLGMDLAGMQTQNPEVALASAGRAAIWMRDLDKARAVAERVAGLQLTGGFTDAQRNHIDAAVAALEGRTDEAVAGFREAVTWLQREEMLFAAATNVVDATVLLPGHAEVRAWAAEVRPLLVELRARPYLERLDAALVEAPPTTPQRRAAETSTETVSS
jgi:tetratricopeptide (TPR) repeat protein